MQVDAASTFGVVQGLPPSQIISHFKNFGDLNHPKFNKIEMIK